MCFFILHELGNCAILLHTFKETSFYRPLIPGSHGWRIESCPFALIWKQDLLEQRRLVLISDADFYD